MGRHGSHPIGIRVPPTTYGGERFVRDVRQDREGPGHEWQQCQHQIRDHESESLLKQHYALRYRKIQAVPKAVNLHDRVASQDAPKGGIHSIFCPIVK